MKQCKLCKKAKSLKLFRVTYIKNVNKYYYRAYCNMCLNKIRNLLRKNVKYKRWQSERCKKQYTNRKLLSPLTK